MNEIKKRLQELEDLNQVKVNWDAKDAINSFDNRMKHQRELLEELKKLALEQDTLLGREVRFPHADSYAVYVVSRVNKRSVQVTWVDYCDGWQDDRLEYEGNLPLEYVEKQVRGRDHIEKMFS